MKAHRKPKAAIVMPKSIEVKKSYERGPNGGTARSRRLSYHLMSFAIAN